MGQVAKRLTQAFKQAAENVIENLFGKEVAELEARLAEVRAYITDFEETVKKNFQAAIDEIIKPYEEHIKAIQSVEAIS